LKSIGEDTKVPASDSDIAILDTRESFPFGLKKKKILMSDAGEKRSQVLTVGATRKRG
jgi:hypothetical protein